MRTLIAVAVAALALALPPAHGQTVRPPLDEAERMVTRHGPVILEKTDDVNPPRWRVRLDDRVVVETEYDTLDLVERFAGADGRDYVLVRRDSGGIACPYQFRVVELGPRGALHLSEEFGSCLEPTKMSFSGGALVLEMPAYIPHRDLLSPREIRQRERTTEIYTVRDGTVTHRDRIR
jgi:hypothetical protein